MDPIITVDEQAPATPTTETAPKKTKTAPGYPCFFCAEKHEAPPNTTGHISFNDGEYDRKIFICHYCAAQSIEDIFRKANKEKLSTLLGELMFARALDSRAW